MVGTEIFECSFRAVCPRSTTPGLMSELRKRREKKIPAKWKLVRRTQCVYMILFWTFLIKSTNKQTLQQINDVHSKEVIFDLLNASQDATVHRVLFERQVCLKGRQELLL
jgi:hypothetical protein